MKTVYIFQCSDKKSTYAFTLDNSTINIPHEHCTGKWNRVKEMVISEDTPSVIGISAKKILDALSQNKYFITDIDLNAAEQTIHF